MHNKHEISVYRSAAFAYILAFFLAFVLTVSLLTAMSANAEIFKTVDANGNVTFSDKAPDGGEAIEIKPANSLPAVTRPPVSDQNPDDDEDSISYNQLSIASPANDSSIGHGPGDFTVSVSVQPALDEKHRLRLYLNGAAQGRDRSQTSFQLTAIDRGTHTLQVRIIDEDGYTVKKSAVTSVHVFRPSVLAPGYRGG